MNKTIQTTAILFIILISVFSCKKSSNNTTSPPPADQRANILTKGSWHRSNEGLDSNRDGTIDVVDGHLQPCNADDIITFNGDGTMTWSEGPTKCNTSDQDTVTLTWEFTKDGINLLGRDLKIFKLTDTDFLVYYEETSGATTVWEMLEFTR